jgi:putative flippase GtrA
MQTFIKTQAALIAGSMADFLLTWLLVDVFNCWYVSSNAAGNICGAVAQFLLSRYWVFTKARQKPPAQVYKFIVMWVGNIALSSLGVYLLTNFTDLHYLFSKLLVSVLLGVSYTYWVSKKFVFV